MRTDLRIGLLWIVASSLALAPVQGQTPPPAPAKSSKKAAPSPRPPKPAPPTTPPAATPAPKPVPPKPPPAPPAKNPEDEAIIEQLELFMLMEMMKDYEILRETER